MPRIISEERTRKEMIDPQLACAGCFLRDHSKVKIEISVDGYDAEPWNGVSDYTLYGENGEVLAVVEAKKTADVFYQLKSAQFIIEIVPTLEKNKWKSGRFRKSELYEPPLDMFGADAVERWFTQKEVEEVVEFANKMAI